jgi:hypothetical protein
MSPSFSKKNNECIVNEYMNEIKSKCEKSIPVIKNQMKIENEKITIPTIDNYKEIPKYKYSVTHLKQFAKHYKLKISGNKHELLTRVYCYLYFSSFITKIQQVFKGYLVRKYKELHGPAATNRKLCTNETDFITMEPIEEINFHQFISYKDQDGFIYGFDIISIHTLYSKGSKEMKNPYNRNSIPETILKNIKSLIRLSKLLDIQIHLHFENDMQTISNEKNIELRTLSLFQNIDALGNYSNPQWFLSLSRNNIIKFVRELMDIWNYRAQLLPEIKRKICPPNGDPFRNLHIPYIQVESNMTNVKKVVLEVLEKMVNNGIDKDSKCLGAYYVLGALTMVNSEAANSLPWLFQSVNYF